MRNRINKLLNYSGMTKKDFSVKIGISEQTLNNYTNKGRIVSTEVLQKIIQSFNEINPAWLLMGEGSMLREQSTINTDEVENLKDLVKLQREKIQSLELELDNFKNKNIYEESKEYSS